EMRFGRETQTPEIQRPTRHAILRYGMFDRPFATVVSGNGNQPVAVELIVEILQVIESRPSGLDDIAPTVIPPVLLQAKARPRARYELPQPRSPRVGISIRLERAFEDGEQRNLERHATRLELRDDMIEIGFRVAERTLEMVRMANKCLELLIDLPLPRGCVQLEPRMQAREQ